MPPRNSSPTTAQRTVPNSFIRWCLHHRSRFAHQHLIGGASDASVKGAGRFGHVSLGPLLRLEISVRVDATDQRREIALSNGLADRGRQVANGKTDAAAGGGVGVAAVDQPHMWQ